MATSVSVTFSVGTNLGDRSANIHNALALLDSYMRSHYIALSPIIETEACGFDGPPFLNCVVRYRSARSPESILTICKRIEREMGRTDGPEWDAAGNRIYHNRIIDIDILTYGKKEIHTESLTIPHSQIYTRPFIKELLLLL